MDGKVVGAIGVLGGTSQQDGVAPKHKLVGLLREKLRADGISVGEVVVLGIVKGGAFDTGSATIEPRTVADKFWEIYSDHESRSVTVP
jgi:hypothetical protein